MKRIKILTTTLAALFCVSVAAAQTAQDVTKKYLEAAKLLEKQDKSLYESVAAMMEEVVKTGTPLGADVVNEVANAKKCLPDLYYNIAVSQAQQNKLAEAEASALKAYNKAQEYKTGQAHVLKAEDLLAKIYIAQAGKFVKEKNYAQASEIYAKGLKSIPNSTTLEMYLAISYVESGNKEQGYAIFNQIIEKAKTNPRYKRSAEQAKEKMENYDNVEANKALAAKNYTKAVALLTDIIKANPDNALAQMMLIQAYASLNRENDVISKGPAALAVQTDQKNKCDICYMMGVACFNQQKNDKALEYLKMVTTGNNVTKAKDLITEINELSKANK